MQSSSLENFENSLPEKRFLRMAKKIVVCVKQVPDVIEVRLDPETHTLIREGVPSVLNPFDEFAVEEAVRLKEKMGGTVTAVTMGPPQAEEALKTCLAMGADEAYLLCDQKLAGSDTWATSMALSAMVNRIGFDIIVCGVETTDSSTAQVGPEMAEKLGVPQITFASKIELDEKGRKGTFTRETDTGYQIMEARLPLVVTVVKGINVPRKPDNALAEGKIIGRLTVDDIAVNPGHVGLDGSPTRVFEINAAKARARAQLVIDSSLPAHERIKMLMMGGIQKKEGSRQIQEDAGGMARKAGDFIIELLAK
jgi:electron transfer flavoprotein alpha/beta subunit